jgi:hypothetical protein
MESRGRSSGAESAGWSGAVPDDLRLGGGGRGGSCGCAVALIVVREASPGAIVEPDWGADRLGVGRAGEPEGLASGVDAALPVAPADAGAVRSTQ